MTPFSKLWDAACARKGGDAAVEAMLSRRLPREALRELSDASWLSEMSLRVFAAGFNLQVVRSKWPAFEEALEGFDPWRCAVLPDEALDRLAENPNLIRNRAKMESIRENAAFLRELADESATHAAAVFADWPITDFIGLVDLLKRRGSRLGGLTGQRVLRAQGVDGFILTPDVTAALIREGVVDAAPTSKPALAAVQTAFDVWRAESGRPMMQISRVLALTVEPGPTP